MASPSIPFDYASLFPGYSPTYPANGDPYSTYNKDWSQSDPAYAMKQNAGYMGAWGQTFGSQLTAQQQIAQNNQGEYGQAANLEGSNILDTPGFTQDEYGNIINTAGYQGGMTTPEGFASLNPTASETAGITGNPSSFLDYFQSTPSDLASNVSQGSTMADDAITSGQLQAGTAMGQEANTINDVYSRTGLDPSSGYYDAMASAVSPQNLKLNLDPSYQMSDQEVQDMQSQAAETVSGSEQSRQDQIQQRMQASGTSDPLAYAALSRETQGNTAEEAANAVTSARIAAEDAQRQTKMNYAQAYLGAGQTASGLEMTAAQEAEQAGVTAEQFKAQGQVGASEALAGQGVNQAQFATGQGVGTSEDYSHMYQQALQYAASTGISVEEAMNQVSTGAASQLYGIRQGNTQYQQEQQYGQNYQTQAQLSNLYGEAAAARIAGQNTGLNWATGEQVQNQNTGMGLNQQQISTAQATFPQINAATGQWGQYALGVNGMSFGTNLGKSFANFMGSGFGLSPNYNSGSNGGGSSWGIN